MKKPILDADTARRLHGEIGAELDRRVATWTEFRDGYAEVEGQRLFDEWLSSMRAKFLNEARATYEKGNPRPTFERVASDVLRKMLPQESVRASAVAELAPDHEKTWARIKAHNERAAEPSEPMRVIIPGTGGNLA